MIIAFLAPFNIPKFVTKIEITQKIESKQTMKRFLLLHKTNQKFILGCHSMNAYLLNVKADCLVQYFPNSYNSTFFKYVISMNKE